MASTHIEVTNESDTPIIANCTWGYSLVSSANIAVGKTGQLPCEYVWYDVTIYNPKTNAQFARITGVYGTARLSFSGNNGDYFINTI